ncbi:MAG TPA: hypothetical protein VGL91_20380 [Acidobacteriota bacterium]|jgi:hypothetical protein
MPRIFSFAAPLVLLVSFLLMLRRVEPFYTNFYSIAWWCYILWLASRNELRAARSRFQFPSLFRQPRQYFALILLSAAVWFFFELYNARLHNWAYVGMPLQRWIRWPGYFLAYGTVLPGIFETARWLEGRFDGESAVNGHQESPERDARWNPALGKLVSLFGLGCMILPLLVPRFFFPLVWGGLIFLLDPLVESIGQRNLVLNLFVGDRSRPLLLLGSGLICGFFWELWNFWAGAKWVYTLPYFQFWRIFEMPALGFLGFPPFALECWLLFVFVRYFWEKHGRAGRLVTIIGIAAICAVGIYVVDHFVVKEYVTRTCGDKVVPIQRSRLALPPGSASRWVMSDAP